MIRYPLTATPHTSLFIGGYARSMGESDGDTAADEKGMLIPGSAIKGALRESAVRLVNGAGRGQEMLEKLFGAERKEGMIRVGPLRAGHGPEPTSRFHVSLERATRQAAPGRLFQNRVTASGLDLAFHGELTVARALHRDEQGLLASALSITDQIGGGRGRGLGLVTLLLGEPEEQPEDVAGDWTLEEERGTLVLELAAAEPLQLGIVKDLSNVATSKGFLDGSAVRGAVAATLANLDLPEELETVVVGERPAVFGNGYPGHSSAVPAPFTLRVPKAGGYPAIDDAARLCAHAVGGRRFCRVHDRRAASGSFAHSACGWTRVTVERRMITRTARNLVDGRAADGKLFSLEVVEPTLEPGPFADHGELRFYVPVHGTKDQLRAVERAASAGLAVGGARSRGFGRLRLVDVDDQPLFEPIAERHRRWNERLAGLGLERPERTGVLLAVGPLAVSQDRLIKSLEAAGLTLCHGISRRRAHGGWNRHVSLPRGVSSHFLPGSTWIVESRDGSSAEGALAHIEQRGIGPGRPDGWGRLIACHPIHVDCCEED